MELEEHWPIVQGWNWRRNGWGNTVEQPRAWDPWSSGSPPYYDCTTRDAASRKAWSELQALLGSCLVEEGEMDVNIELRWIRYICGVYSNGILTIIPKIISCNWYAQMIVFKWYSM